MYLQESGRKASTSRKYYTPPKLASPLRPCNRYIELPCSNIENMLPFHNLQAMHTQLKPRTTLHEIAIYRIV